MSFLVVGEALVDVVRRPDGSRLVRPGGSAANVAVTLGRQGRSVRLLTALGEDEDGRLLRTHLEGSGVDVLAAPLPRTPVAQAVLDERGEASYGFELDWDLGDLTPPRHHGWLHVGSLGSVLEPGASRVRAVVEQHTGPVSLDPNCRPELMGPVEVVRPRVEELVSRADLVKLSAQDAGWLFPGEPLLDLARRWLGLGPSLVVVTLGDKGALGVLRDHALTVPAADGLPVCDTVGAGDAFAGGLLAALEETQPAEVDAPRLRHALEHAATLARRTCERPGADPPWTGALL